MNRSPHRRQRKAGARLFYGLAPALLLLAALCAGTFLSARFLPRPLERDAIPPVPNSSDASAPYSSLSRSLSSLNRARLEKLWTAYSSPKSQTGSAPRHQLLRIDSESLARLHPAFLLAQSLETAATLPREGRLFFIRPRLQTSPANPVWPREMLRPPQHEWNGYRLESRGMEQIFDRDQTLALADFDRAWTDRQYAMRADERALRERELEDLLRDQARSFIAPVGLKEVNAEAALELSNLRLQLLQNLALSPLQRETARARIAAIEERFALIWRNQTAQREAELEKLTKTLPARLRREGLEKIRGALGEMEHQDRAERARILGEMERLARDDFAAAKTQKLALILPRATSVALRAPWESEAPHRFYPDRFHPEASALARVFQSSPNTQLGQIARALPDQIAVLKARARADARVWAYQAAQQMGGTLSDSPRATDATTRAKQLLWPGNFAR